MAEIRFTYSPLGASYVITSAYGYRTPPKTSEGNTGTSNHAGIDLGVNGNPNGTVDVIAVMSGTVTRASWYGNYGNCIEIDHGNGYTTLYGHLHSIAVSRGTTIPAGTVLGKMGSTGNSSGPHLHFELKYNGEQTDPTSALSGGTITLSTDDLSYNTEGSEDIPLSEADTPYTPLSIVGKRVTSVSQQPINAYVNIYLGEKLLSTNPPKPNILQSFEFTRISDAGSTASFTIFDDQWDTIEPLLAAYWNEVYIDYGYSGVGLASKRYLMELTNYTISFNNTGVLLSISAVSQGAMENLKSVNVSLNTYNPTEAVKAICRSQGWKVLKKNFDESEDVHRDNPYNLVQEYPLSYIQNVIVPETRNDGEIFRFYLDEDNVAYFKKVTYSSENSNEVRTYIYQKGYDSTVLDLSFDIKGVFGGTTNFSVASGVTSSVFDTKSKKSTTKKYDNKSTVTESTGKKQHTKSDQSVPNVESAGSTADQTDHQLFYYVKNATNRQYEATLTILGDPTIELLENVRVINVTDAGHLHHTSGIYMVSGISDSYSDGKLITTLKLIRNGNINEGVELINPKSLIK